jgi:malic enzyme
MPPLSQVRAVSDAVADAVALAAVAEGLATRAGTPTEARQRLAECRWEAEYRQILPG